MFRTGAAFDGPHRSAFGSLGEMPTPQAHAPPAVGPPRGHGASTSWARWVPERRRSARPRWLFGGRLFLGVLGLLASTAGPSWAESPPSPDGEDWTPCSPQPWWKADPIFSGGLDKLPENSAIPLPVVPAYGWTATSAPVQAIEALDVQVLASDGTPQKGAVVFDRDPPFAWNKVNLPWSMTRLWWLPDGALKAGSYLVQVHVDPAPPATNGKACPVGAIDLASPLTVTVAPQSPDIKVDVKLVRVPQTAVQVFTGSPCANTYSTTACGGGVAACCAWLKPPAVRWVTSVQVAQFDHAAPFAHALYVERQHLSNGAKNASVHGPMAVEGYDKTEVEEFSPTPWSEGFPETGRCIRVRLVNLGNLQVTSDVQACALPKELGPYKSSPPSCDAALCQAAAQSQGVGDAGPTDGDGGPDAVLPDVAAGSDTPPLDGPLQDGSPDDAPAVGAPTRGADSSGCSASSGRPTAPAALWLLAFAAVMAQVRRRRWG